MSSTVTPALAQPTGPAVRRVITGHTADGKAVILEDKAVAPRPVMGRGPSFFTDLFWTENAVAENHVEWTDTILSHSNEHVGPQGSSFRAVDFPPNQVTPYHRTISIDYAIVTSGSITLILDDDKRVILNAGDVLVQRGTIHGWHNHGTEWCRMFCILLPSEKVKIGDQELAQEFQPPRK